MKHLLNKFNRQKVEIVVIQTFLSSKVILDCVITTWVFYQKREDGTELFLLVFLKVFQTDFCKWQILKRKKKEETIQKMLLNRVYTYLFINRLHIITLIYK